MKLECFFCTKKYEDLEELGHHLELEHKGMPPEILQKAMASLATKNQLGDYLGPNNKGTAFECPHCFEFFSDLAKLEAHGKTVHELEFNPEFVDKLRSMRKFDENHPPICDKCHLEFLGLVTTKFDGVVVHVCFTCYEEHYGKNALTRLTIGTPDSMIEKMRKPVR